ncbi:MAG TPA: PAS domain-containing protein, partial [Kiloniellales bacterium]|nr:PAS domain-containing protein [Kiloniellales bacterium]
MAARTRSRKRPVKPKADLTTLPEENPSPVLRVDHAARVIYANAAARRLLGVESDNGSTLPADLATVLRSAVAKGKSASAQMAADGRDYALSIVPVKGAGYVNIYGRDNTDELRVQKEMADLARFPEENPNPVLRVRFDGRLLYANTGARSVKGLVIDNGRRIGTELARAIDSAVAAGQYTMAEIRFNGRLFAFAMTPIEEAGYVNAYGRDITEQWEAQQRAEDLARFPDENPNPVIRVRFDGELLFANKGARAIKGLVVDKGRRIAAELARAIDSAIAAGQYTLAEIRFNGRLFAFAMTPIADAGYVNAYGRDITEQWEAQQRAEDLAKFPEENPNPVFR